MMMKEKQQEDSPDSRVDAFAPRFIYSDTTPVSLSNNPAAEKPRQWPSLPNPELSRRSFLAFVGASSAVGAVAPGDFLAAEPEPVIAPETSDSGLTRLTVNGVLREAKVDVRTTLLDY